MHGKKEVPVLHTQKKQMKKLELHIKSSDFENELTEILVKGKLKEGDVVILKTNEDIYSLRVTSKEKQNNPVDKMFGLWKDYDIDPIRLGKKHGAERNKFLS